MDQDGRWREEWAVPARYAETPFTGVCFGLGRAAGRHATQLGFGIEALHARQLTWMLSRLLVRLARPLLPGEPLHVITWPSGVQRLFALREFELIAMDGAKLGAGRSGWFLVDLAARRPVDPAAHFAHLSSTARAIDAPLDRVDQAFELRASREVVVDAVDIDVNGHVTFTSYIGWIERALMEARRAHALVELEINYLAEVFLGQTLRVELGPTTAASGEGDVWIAHVLRGEDGEVVAKARLGSQPIAANG